MQQGFIPPKLGRYEVLFPLGAGGMAPVFAGRLRGEAGFQKAVAIKAMRPHLARQPRFFDMFLDEGRIAASVDSPYVVRTLELGRQELGRQELGRQELGRQEDVPFLVMELIVGRPLSRLIARARERGRSIPLRLAVAVAVDAARGLHAVHNATSPCGTPLSVVHRDVSPENLLVGADGRTRICDFGIVRADLRQAYTAAGEWKGKAHYCAPEQMGRAPLDRRVDVFALGLIAWELCSGYRLFQGEAFADVASAVRTTRIPRLDEVVDVPAELANAVAAALVRDPSRRTPSARHFCEDLQRAARSSVGIATESEVAALVEELVGDDIGALRSRLQAAFRAPGPRRRREGHHGSGTAPFLPEGPAQAEIASQATLLRRPSNRTPSGRTPSGRTPSGRTPAAQRPWAQRPWAQPPAAQRPWAQPPAAQRPWAQRPWFTPVVNALGIAACAALGFVVATALATAGYVTGTNVEIPPLAAEDGLGSAERVPADGALSGERPALRADRAMIGMQRVAPWPDPPAFYPYPLSQGQAHPDAHPDPGPGRRPKTLTRRSFKRAAPSTMRRNDVRAKAVTTPKDEARVAWDKDKADGLPSLLPRPSRGRWIIESNDLADPFRDAL